jgi:hypothetical protein
MLPSAVRCGPFASNGAYTVVAMGAPLKPQPSP